MQMSYWEQVQAVAAGRGCGAVEEGWIPEREEEAESAENWRDQLAKAASVSCYWRWSEAHGTQAAEGVKGAFLPTVSAAQTHTRVTINFCIIEILTLWIKNKALHYDISISSISSTFWWLTGPWDLRMASASSLGSFFFRNCLAGTLWRTKSLYFYTF